MDGTMTRIRYEKISNAGTFWRSAATRDDLKTVLRDNINDGLFKSANVAAGGETEFEQAFSSLAYAYLKDKAPRLLEFLVGFQLVDRNEDNTKAMGVFGFSVGDQWLYAPVFFLNGDLKGHELLYLKNKDAFVPMKENWVNYLISRKPHVLGESSSQDTFQLGGLRPNVLGLSQSPGTGIGKRGFDQWSRPFLPVYAATKMASASSLYKSASQGTKLDIGVIASAPYQAALAEIASDIDLDKIISSNFGVVKAAFDIAQNFPGVRDGFTRFYGKDCFSRWGAQVKEAAVREQNSILPSSKLPEAPRYTTTKSLIPETDDRPEHPTKSGALRMYVYEHVTVKGAPELTDNEREKLMEDTVLIKDHREGEEVSKAYNTQMDMRLINPDETNLYRVLERPGNFTKMFVAVNPLSNNGAQDMVTAVRLEGSGNKAWLNSYTGNVFVDQEAERDEWDEWFDGLSDSDSLSVGNTYIAVLPTHSSTVPFVVRENYGDGTYKVDFENKPHYNETRIVQHTRAENGNYSGGYDPQPSPYGAILRVDAEGGAGTRLRAVGGSLRVPGVAKFLKLKEAYSSATCGLLMPAGPSEGDHSDPSPIQFGDIEDIQSLFYEKTARLKLYRDGHEFSITSPEGTKRAAGLGALLSLVGDHGFNEKTAREMLKEATRKQSSIYRVVYAPGFGNKKHLVKSAAPTSSVLAGGPNAPYGDMTPEYGMEMLGGRTPVQTQHANESLQVVPELQASNTDSSVWDPWQNYQAEDFQNIMGVAQEAAGSGQKEIFDTAMIGTLLKSVRQDSLVDRHLGDLMKAINSLGRILFLFYWHQEEFEDRYGKSDMPELEDSLRNAFEALGDVTLFLKEKTIESPFNENAELNLEESARN
jgi:hypothetical protein